MTAFIGVTTSLSLVLFAGIIGAGLDVVVPLVPTIWVFGVFGQLYEIYYFIERVVTHYACTTLSFVVF